jgi:hypothetical protein
VARPIDGGHAVAVLQRQNSRAPASRRVAEAVQQDDEGTFAAGRVIKSCSSLQYEPVLESDGLSPLGGSARSGLEPGRRRIAPATRRDMRPPAGGANLPSSTLSGDQRRSPGKYQLRSERPPALSALKRLSQGGDSLGRSPTAVSLRGKLQANVFQRLGLSPKRPGSVALCTTTQPGSSDPDGSPPAAPQGQAPQARA